VRKAAHGALAKVSENIEKLHFNVCLAQIREFTNALVTAMDEVAEKGGDARDVSANEDFKVPADISWAVREAATILVQLIHPMMPHVAEECWGVLGHTTLVATQPWPQVEQTLLVEDTVTLPVQVNGKKRADVTVARDAGNVDIEAAVLALEAVQRALDGKVPKKVIVVPQRIVNVVA
jgi:leucyl-tRNA synthetase